VRMWYCPIRRGRQRQDEIEAYYPGDEATQIVGFDVYDSRRPPKPMRKKWRGTIETLQRIAPDKPIWVGEFGKARRTGSRIKWLKGLDDVKGVAVVIYFDMDLGPGHRWLLSPKQRRAYMGSAS